MIDLRHLRTIDALREMDSVHDEAERLHLAQSALSHQFRELDISFATLEAVNALSGRVI